MVAALSTAMPSIAETPVQLWATESPGHSGAASGRPGCGVKPYAQRAMAIDAGGNSYVTGCSPNPNSNNDYFTVKYDPSGSAIWKVRYEGTANNNLDTAFAIAVDGDGNVYVTGQSVDSIGGTNYATVKYNNAGTQLWVATYNGTGDSDDYANALVVDVSGNVTVTGRSFGSSGGYNYATVQYNSAGVQQWVAIYNGTGNGTDYAYALAVDASGNITVTGQAYGSSGNYDYATVQYNNAGTQQWVTTYNGTGNYHDIANTLAVDGDGNVYVTGQSVDSIGGTNYATVQYNSAGVQQWVAIYNGSGDGYDQANALVVDTSGNVTVTGRSVGSIGGTNYATVKYDNAGAQLWVAIYNGTGNSTDQANALAVDASGNVTVTGQSYNGSNDDYATVQYNSAGVQQWAATYNGTGNSTDESYALAVDGDGNVYVTGASVGSSGGFNYATVQYNSAGVQQWVSDPVVESQLPERLSTSVGARKMVVDAAGNTYVAGSGFNGRNYDYRVAKFDATGALVWSATYNGTGNGTDQANDLAVDASGNVTVTGYAQGSSGGVNYATVQYNSAGVQQWVAIYNGTGNGGDYATALAVDVGGNLYVTGQSFDGAANNYLTIKYNSGGTQQWLAAYNGTGNSNDAAYAIAVDTSGNIAVTGLSNGSSGGFNYATIKYNAAGMQQWVAIYNGTGNAYDYGYDLALDASGNVYVAGQSTNGSGNYDYATIKYNAGGVQQWVATYNGTGNSTDDANGLAVDASGNVTVTGRSVGSSGGDNYATVRYNSAGVQQWVAIYNGTGNSSDTSYALAVDTSGNVTVTGQSYNGTSNDYATVKYASDGTQLWAHNYDGGRGLQDTARAVAVAANGRVTIAGTVHENSGYDRIGVVRIAAAYTVTASAFANGSITPASQTVLQADDAQFTVTPATGYHVDTLTGTTCSPVDLGGGLWEAANITQDCAVTATFAINQYTLTYTAGANGSITGASPQTVNHGSDGTSVTAVPDANYHFVNWSDSSIANPRTDTNVTANVAVTANFAIDTYTLTYAAGANGSISGVSPQTVDHATSGSAVTAVPNTGYSFVNWSDGSTANPRTDSNVMANVSVTANFAIKQYTLTYTAGANGSISGTSPQTVNHGSDGSAVSAVADTGYQFVQWSDTSTGNPRTDSNVTSNITVTAQFSAQQYTVSFDSQGGSAVASITQDFASTVTVPAAPTRTGYTFSNWNTASDGSGTSYAPAATFSMPANNSTLFAIWTINQYTLSFDAQGGSVVAAITQDFASTVTVPAAPARTGYTFANWNTASDGTGTSYAPAATFSMPANDSTLFAIWTINAYTVSFDSQGGSAVAAITQDFASTVTVPAAPTRSGYTFSSWNSAADGSGTNYAPAATFSMPANDSTLYAIWTINAYTVSFDSQGGSAVTAITQDFASTVTVPAAPTRSGYTFSTWNTAADGSGTNYAPAATFAMPANDSTLFAIWTINQYTVSFDSQGGSAVAAITQDFASTVTVPAAPTRSGYSFASWNTASDGTGTNYAPAATFSMPANNSTLFAIWTINQYTVSFDSQGGSLVTAITQDFASTVTVPAAPTRSGHTFSNWNTAANGSGTSYAPAATFPMPANNSTLFAIWTINAYTVSFDSQGGSAVAAITQNFASTVTVPAAPTRSGYTFSNWNTASDGSGTSYAPTATFSMPANNSTLFAIWTINQYTVSFDSQGGSAVSAITQNFASTVTVPAAPTRSGYTFASWNTASDGTGTNYAPAATFSMPANNSTLFAIWTINQYTVSFDSQGGSVVASITQDFASTVTVPAAPTRSGYTFSNWNTAANGSGTSYAPAATFSMPANNSTLFAIWTINQYTVSFDSQGGSVVASITQDFASTVTVPAAPTRSGHTFSNWNSASDGTGTNYAPAATFSMPANNSTLFAIWTINQYTVSFDSQGGSAVASITQDFASTVTVPAAPTRSGYTFANWNTASDGTGTSYAPAATFPMPANNSTLFAIWTINQYTVSFDSQGGSVVASITQDFASTVTVPAAPTRSGYTFASWNTAANESGTSYAPAATFPMPANNSTLFAIWTINQYTVSFDAQGGSAVASITQDFASTVTVPDAPTRSGYTFSSWNSASDGTGTNYAPAATFAMPANNSTLFAIWTINQYTVSFDSEGGSAVASITQDFASTVIVPAAPTRAGYTFVSWNSASDGTGTNYAPAATFAMPANNSTLFAIWNNTVPTLAALDEVLMNEDGSVTVIVDVGDSESMPAALTVVASSAQPTVLPDPSVAVLANPGQRELLLSPVANANGGPITVTVTVTDEGGLSSSRTFPVTIRPVNDAPTFITTGDRIESSGATGLRTVPNFIQSLSVGPADEQSQLILGYSVVQVSDPEGVISAISVAVDGTLSYTLTGSGGSADFEIRATDNGGSANGGHPTSDPVAFGIDVAVGADLQISLSNGRTSVAPGESVLYDIYVANAGPNDVTGARVQNSIPLQLTGAIWTCAPILRAQCSATTGTGSIDTLVNLQAGGVAHYTVLAVVADTAVDTVVTYTATITSPADVAELSPFDNTDTDTDPVLVDGLFRDGFEEGANRITVPWDGNPWRGE